MAGNAGSIRAGKAHVEVGVDNTPLHKGLMKSRELLGTFKSILKSSAVGFGAGVAFAGVMAGFKLLEHAAKGAIEGIKEIFSASREFSEANRDMLSPEQVEAAEKLREAFSIFDNSLTQSIRNALRDLTPLLTSTLDVVRLLIDGFGRWARSCGPLQSALKLVTDAMMSIRNALSADDWGAAGEAASAALRVAMADGLVKLMTVINGFHQAFAGIFAAAGAAILPATTAAALQRALDELAKARKDFDAINDRNRKRRKGPHPDDLPPGEDPGHVQQAQSETESVARASFNVAGTFSGAAVSRLGHKTGDEQLITLRTIATYTKRTAIASEKGQVVQE